MHFHYCHWKNLMGPMGIGLIAIWSLYLAAVSIFQPIDAADDSGDARSAEHNSSDRKGSGSPARSSNRETSKLSAEKKRSSSRNASSDKKAGASVVTVTTARSATKAKPQKLAYAAARKPSRDVTTYNRSSAAHEAKQVLRDSIINEAVSLAFKSEKPWENLIAVAHEQFRRGEKEDAREILLMAEKIAVDPDDPKASSIAIREVVKAMLTQRQPQDAVNSLQNIQSFRERERTVGEVAAWSARLGELGMARNLIVQITNAKNRDVALVAIAESEATLEGATVAIQTVSSIHDSKKKDDAYRRISLKRSALQDFVSAERAVKLIRDQKLQDATTTSIARQRARTGDVAGGLQMMQGVSDPLAMDASLRKLATELARLGRFSRSAYVSTRIRSASERSYALESISIEQARAGDLSGSLVRLDSIPVDSVRERTLRSVSSVTANKGRPERARNVAIRINSGIERDRAYRAIAKAATADGNHVMAYNTLQQISLPAEKALALVDMARTRQRQGDDRQALALLEDANRAALTVQSAHTVDRIQSDLAVAYAERAESGHSLILADNIRNLNRRDNTYRHLARTLAGRDLYAAQQSVSSISSERIRINAEDSVARTFAKGVSPKDAVKSARSLSSSRQQIVFLLAVSRKT